MQGSRNDEKTLKKEEDNLRSAGFPPSHIHSRNFGVKTPKFNMNDQEPLARVGKASH